MSYWAKAHRTFASYYSCSCLCFLLLSECIKCYESAGVRRQTERERDIEWKQRKSRQIAEAKTIWVGEKKPHKWTSPGIWRMQTHHAPPKFHSSMFFFFSSEHSTRPPANAVHNNRAAAADSAPSEHYIFIFVLVGAFLVHKILYTSVRVK